MNKAILGKKIGMTRIFGENDISIPVTVVACGPMTVVDKRTVDRNGYSAVVCAFEEIPERKLNKPEKGLFGKAKVKPCRYLREFRYENADSYDVGNIIDCTMFADGDMVDVSGVSKGHGFSGVIKRCPVSTVTKTSPFKTSRLSRSTKSATYFSFAAPFPVPRADWSRSKKPLSNRDIKENRYYAYN